LDVAIEHLENPRVEMEEHYYNATHTGLLELGLKPHLLSETLVESMFGVIERHRDRVIPEAILLRTRWRGRVLPVSGEPAARRRAVGAHWSRDGEEGPMIGLRVVGGLAAAVLFVLSIRRYQRRIIFRLSLIVTGFVSIGVLVLAISPS